MRTHVLAMVALLTAAVATGCSSAREVSDTKSEANAWGCNQCHGYPPPPFFTDSPDVFPHAAVTGAMCNVCHPDTVAADGHTIISNGKHRDGQIEAVYGNGDPLPAAAACDSCHATPPDTGKHLFHFQTRGVACATCHMGFDPATRAADDSLHMQAKKDSQGREYFIVDDGKGGAPILKAAGSDGSWPGGECNACHAALGVSD